MVESSRTGAARGSGGGFLVTSLVLAMISCGGSGQVSSSGGNGGTGGRGTGGSSSGAGGTTSSTGGATNGTGGGIVSTGGAQSVGTGGRTGDTGGRVGGGGGGLGGMGGLASTAGGTSSGGAFGSGGDIGSGGARATGGVGGKVTTGGTSGATALPATTVWIAGDSTVKTYAAGNTDGTNGTSLEGWGQEIGQYFSSKVTINNQALGGRAIATFMWQVERDSAGTELCVDTAGTGKFSVDASGNRIDNTWWAKMKTGMKAGDFLLMQFGHNDESDVCPRHVSTTDYETDFGIMADAAAAKGATVIFVTPMPRRIFSGTKVDNRLLPYANAAKDEASKKHIEVEDLNLRAAEYYESVGNTYLSTQIFDGGGTHFIKAGAVKMAELIVGEVKKNKGALSAYLK